MKIRTLYSLQELMRRSNLPLAKLTDEVTTGNEESCGSAAEWIIGVVGYRLLHDNIYVQGMRNSMDWRIWYIKIGSKLAGNDTTCLWKFTFKKGCIYTFLRQKRVFSYMHYKTLFLIKHYATPTLDMCHFMYTVMDFTENVTKKCANRDKTALNFHWRFLISDKCCTALSASLYMVIQYCSSFWALIH